VADAIEKFPGLLYVNRALENFPDLYSFFS